MGNEKVSGQAVIEAMVAFIEKYVELPTTVAGGAQSLVLALWCVHTWMYERFPATPRLSITASTKESGKSVCQEVLACLCRGPEMLATLRPLGLLRVIKMSDSRSTLFVDEAEKLSSAAIGDLRSIFTTGYTSKGEHVITKGEEVSRFKTFAPACFALIGDVMDVVRSRGIDIHLQRAIPSADFRANRLEGEAEGEAIAGRMRAFFGIGPNGIMLGDVPLVQPAFLAGREREIWSVLFSIASAMKLDRATMERLTGAAVDLVQLKGREARTFSDAGAEEKAALGMASEQALRDLALVMGDEKVILSAVAVERMKGLATSPWRTFRGEGLNQVMLSQLVKIHGVHVGTVAVGKGRKGRKTGMGYKRDSVLASVPSVDKGR